MLVLYIKIYSFHIAVTDLAVVLNECFQLILNYCC